MASYPKLVRALKLTGIVLTMSVVEMLMLIGVLCFFLGAYNDQPDASFFGFIIAAVCGYVLKCLFTPLDKVIDER